MFSHRAKERAANIREQVSDPCEWLLQEWHFRREVVDSYHRALRFLTLDSREASQRQRERMRELNEKLSTALIALRRASDQLLICEREHALARSV
jgi:hypothetical protein